MKNQNIAFMLKKRELDGASTEAERIAILQELVQLNPKDSRDLKLRTKYKKELEIVLKRNSSKKYSNIYNPYSEIKYDRQIVLIGETDYEKSQLLYLLTGKDVNISTKHQITYAPKLSMFKYNDVPIQVIDIPSIHINDRDNQKYLFTRNSDVLCIVAKNNDEVNSIKSILENHLIFASGETNDLKNHKYRPKEEMVIKPSFITSQNIFERKDMQVINIASIEEIGNEMYRLLSIQRIYCFTNGKIDGTPLVFPSTHKITVQDFANKLGIRKFKEAKIYSSKAKFEGQTVGMSYVLNDGDKVWLK